MPMINWIEIALSSEGTDVIWHVNTQGNFPCKSTLKSNDLELRFYFDTDTVKSGNPIVYIFKQSNGYWVNCENEIISLRGIYQKLSSLKHQKDTALKDFLNYLHVTLTSI